MTTASAPAKIILFGEHAVVHGRPAIAVPVKSLRAQVRVEKAPPGEGISIVIPATRQRFRLGAEGNGENTLLYTTRLTLRRLNIKRLPDMVLVLDSDIPMGSGLGSGAAVSTALAQALATALDHPMPKPDLNDLVFEIEKAHHGTPSGIDNTTIVYQQPVYFIKGQPIEMLKIAAPFTLLIGDTGQGTPTYITVGDVRKLYEKDPARVTPMFERIGEITRTARAAIEQGTPEIMGALMNENHTLLQKLTVSSVALDVLCEAALQGGALGAKVSGGGRGGNMIALVREPEAAKVAEMLRSAGAVRVIKTRVG